MGDAELPPNGRTAGAEDDGSGDPPAVRLPVRSSVFAPSALGAWAAAAFGLADPVRCRLIATSVNDTYRVDTGNGTCHYLRVARHGWRTAGDVEAELRLIEELRERWLPIAAPMARTAGGYLSLLGAPEGARLAVLFEEAAGEDVREITPAHARDYGRLAARFHDAADAAGGVYPRFHLDLAHLLTGPLAAIRAQMGQHGEPMAELEAVAARVQAKLEALPRRMPDYGVCHGNLHPGNVRFDGQGRPTLFDFDCWGYGWRAYDLAVFLWNSYLERRTKSWRQSRWRAFLRGYAEIRPLPAGLDDLVPLFLIARQVWLMGMDCAGTSGWPPQWLNAGWFETMKGFVRRWTEEFPDRLG